MKRLLAKSEDKGLLWLEEHTLHVFQAIEKFAPSWQIDPVLAGHGAILHDLGKGHPTFQAMLIFNNMSKREYWLSQLAGADIIRKQIALREAEKTPIHRHEFSSLGFLPLFPKNEWPELVEMIVAHHKSIIKDKSGRGLLDLIRELDLEEIIETHFSHWEVWAPAAIEVAKHFGVLPQQISKTIAIDAFYFALEYCRTLGDGWSPLRGLLMAADHFGSAYQHNTNNKAKGLFAPPSFQAFHNRANGEKAHLYPLSQIAVEDPRPHTLVTAPTGAGKTDFLVRRCHGRFFYTLPFQASINSMYLRLKEDMPLADIRRLHAASMVALDSKQSKPATEEYLDMDEHIDLQQHPGATVKVMTPHQLSALVFGTPGHESIALDVRGNDVILDEIHTFNEESQRMVIQIIQALIYHQCRVHIGTATLPSLLADHLVHLLGGSNNVYQVSLSPSELSSFDRHIVHKTYQGAPIDEGSMFKILRKATREQEKVLLVANQVKTAQQWYIKIKQDPELRNYPIVLIHSRYRREDRALLEARLIALQQMPTGGPVIGVATQVVEVSLDISFDRMITQPAPLDALIQRFGRVNRKRSPLTIGKYKPIHLLMPPVKEQEARPYRLELILRSYDQFPDGEVVAENQVQAMIDRVFTELLIPEANNAYIFKDGRFRIRKLQHNPRNTIVEVLKIEGDTCVLASQVDAYSKAPFDKKPLYEIPVSETFQRWNRLRRLELGSYPLVLPDERYRFSEEDARGVIREEEVSIHTQIL
ncbi:MAG: CRISPR-associated helicase Cas3' [Lewinellaceae bacterium]|nr:CRISPR-associated helicase Cas3' [Lewinellaceae bacterium]